MKGYVIKGMYWCAGNNVYIDTQDDENGYSVVCLNGLIKQHIKENSNVTIVINFEESKEK